MDTVQVPEVELNSGHKMPAIGFGTGASAASAVPAEQLVQLIVGAIAAGYRHFDTAAIYGTEEVVGRAAAEALGGGLIKSRGELFVTSKLWCTDAHRDLVLPALQETLRKLGLEYVDLYLIHWPIRMSKNSSIHNAEMMNFDVRETWAAMEECCRLGLAKSIGISNFSSAKIAKLLENATIPPAVNQVEMNVGWQQGKLVQFCREKKIHISAWSPLGANAVMENPVLKEIAVNKNKTLAQVALRWIYEQGATPTVRSFNKERIMQNIQIFDWELSDEEVHKIRQIPQHRAGSGKEFVSADGQYKSIEELWDGEI
ncbi:hypothetical protein ABFS82_09G075000 [Erythranthe guttata]|uniref:methylecgonone reductase-like n=1 Tax=Erythranthe guttata TaxID=4155 RepID=UPI00064D83FD|nr:PREDICTED: methylecgonone reductase-like [Erythranthe guttata]|eukprot:XP_012856054.1 PREDICTED: methylecgonone reductase-like [Erythranthe guttata]